MSRPVTGVPNGDGGVPELHKSSRPCENYIPFLQQAILLGLAALAEAVEADGMKAPPAPHYGHRFPAEINCCAVYNGKLGS